jgi:hypothetical protein
MTRHRAHPGEFRASAKRLDPALRALDLVPLVARDVPGPDAEPSLSRDPRSISARRPPPPGYPRLPQDAMSAFGSVSSMERENVMLASRRSARLERRRRSGPFYRSIRAASSALIGRTSTAPNPAAGQRAAQSSAASSEGSSRMMKAPSCSFVSA